VTNTDVIEVLRQLARSQMRFITVADLCGALGMPDDECRQLLEGFVEQGLLRATQSRKGEPYFWLTPLLGHDQG